MSVAHQQPPRTQPDVCETPGRRINLSGSLGRLPLGKHKLPEPDQEDSLSFLAGGGEMGARMRQFDWSASSIGASDAWPQALRTALRVLLNTNHPMLIWWGPE